MAMSNIEIKMMILDENNRFSRIKKQCEAAANSPEAVQRRERIASHIGRPLNTDMTKLDPDGVKYATTQK
jgi:hypothetical protein